AVRVIASGAWGFASSARVDGKTVEQVAALAVDIAKANARAVKRPVALAPTKAWVDVWQTSLVKDPFRIPIEDKAELLLACNAAALKVAGANFATSYTSAMGEWKLFASSDGAMIEQSLTRLIANVYVTAVDAQKGEFESCGSRLAPTQGGWE